MDVVVDGELAAAGRPDVGCRRMSAATASGGNRWLQSGEVVVVRRQPIVERAGDPKIYDLQVRETWRLRFFGFIPELWKPKLTELQKTTLYIQRVNKDVHVNH